MSTGLVSLEILLAFMAGIATHYGEHTAGCAWSVFGALLFAIGFIVALLGVSLTGG